MKPIKMLISRRLKLVSALFLFFWMFLPQVEASGSIREIKITAAASPEFQKNPEWQKEIRDRVLFCNQIFEKNFGIHFSVHRFAAWKPEDEKRETSLLIQELRSQFVPAVDEIVVGFHKMSQPFGKNAMEDLDVIGTAEFFRGFVVLRDPFQDLTALQRQVTMAHEMIHLFGGIHITGNNAIMNAALGAEPAVQLDADNQAILNLTGDVDFQKGVSSLPPAQIDELIKIYERLIRKNPHSDFYYQLGYFYEVRGLQARAVSVWEEATRYQYSNPMIHWKLGQYYYQSSRFEAAIQELGSAVAFFILPSQKAQQAQAFNFLGVAYYKKGNLDQAMFNWLKGLSANPDSRELQGNLAAAYLQSGDLDRGIAELLKLAAKYPNDRTTLGNLSGAYLQKKDYAKAAEYSQQALKKMAYSEEQKLLEDTKRQLLNKKAAKENVSDDDLMGEIPESALRTNLGAAYLGLGDTDKAIEQLEEAQKLNPRDPPLVERLAHAYALKKYHTRAIEQALLGIEIQKENPNFYVLLAQAYSMTGKLKESMAAAKSGLLYAPAPLRANLHKNIAIMYAQQGKGQEALAELKSSLNDNWNDADTHVKLGYLYAQLNRPEDAKRSFEVALRMDPKQTEAKKALDNLFPKK